MKSKVRKIVVSGSSFVWGVTELDWNVVSIRVWVESNKRIPLFNLMRRRDNPWANFSDVVQGKIIPSSLNTVSVTPKEVAELIAEFVSQYSLPDELNKTTELEISEDGVLIVK